MRNSILIQKILWAAVGLLVIIGLIFGGILLARRAATAPTVIEPPEEYDADSGLPIPAGKFAVCLDPGHGFADPGTLAGEGLVESEVNLAVAMRVRTLLESAGVTVKMTRETNTHEDPAYSLSLEDRMVKANSFGCALFVSLHCDSFPSDPTVRGTRIYHLSDDTKAAASAAIYGEAIGASLGESVRIKPMLRDDSYYVIRNADCPAVLIELGFVTNPEEAKNLTDPLWQDKMAFGIAAGIIKSFNGGNGK